MTGIVWGSETGINTYVGHEFEVLEISVVQGFERCLKPKCRRTRFVINDNEDQGMYFVLYRGCIATFECSLSSSLLFHIVGCTYSLYAQRRLSNYSRGQQIPIHAQSQTSARRM